MLYFACLSCQSVRWLMLCNTGNRQLRKPYLLSTFSFVEAQTQTQAHGHARKHRCDSNLRTTVIKESKCKDDLRDRLADTSSPMTKTHIETSAGNRPVASDLPRIPTRVSAPDKATPNTFQHRYCALCCLVVAEFAWDRAVRRMSCTLIG